MSRRSITSRDFGIPQTLAIGLLVLLALGTAVGLAQAPESAVAESPPDQAAELQRARTIITDTKASDEVRRIGAEDLLRLQSPAATELAAEILGGNGDSSPTVAICEAIAAIGARQAELLDGQLVAPLLHLLGSQDATVRTKAGQALAAFPDNGVAEKLGDLAAQADAPLTKRMAAVDALVPNLDQRRVIGQLIPLLDTDQAELRSQVIAALRPAARQDLGSAPEAWRAWWRQKSELTEQQWLRDRVGLLQARHRESQSRETRLRRQFEQRNQLLADRLIEQLRTTYHLTPQPQKDDLLLRWLRDSLLEVRRAAVSVIAGSIADGNRPSDPVRAELRARFNDESPGLRRAVFDVVAALTDPADAPVVCDRLPLEADPTVREAVLRTLGRLQNPVALPALIAELSRPEAPPGCLVEAAVSLGLLVTHGEIDPAATAPAIQPLKQQFTSAVPEAVRLRAALLAAMASIGSADFTQEFVANLDAAEPDLLLAALDGVRRLGDTSRIDRILRLVGHSEPRVRRRAVEALSVLGGEPAHLEALLNRLNAAVEPHEGVRQTAWSGFVRLLAQAPAGERLNWSDRLAEFPQRRAEYLATLLTDLTGERPPPPQLDAVRERLAGLYTSEGRQAEALPLWRDLWLARREAGDEPALAAATSFLRAILAVRRYDALSELLPALAEGRDAAVLQPVMQILDEHLAIRMAAPQQEDLPALLEALERIPAELRGSALQQRLIQARQPTPSPTTAPAEG